MRETYRIKAEAYTDSDVLPFYMKYRESGIGPFIREVGDFIAHEKRDRGLTLEASTYIYSQIAFFQTYQGTGRRSLNPLGECPWWLKTYLMGKLKDAKPRDIKEAIGLSINEVRSKIKGWFPDHEQFPCQIACDDVNLLSQLVQLFSSLLRGGCVFDINNVRAELKVAFSLEKISFEELPHFLIATAVLLSGRSCEIVPGFSIGIHLYVSQGDGKLMQMYETGASDEQISLFLSRPDGGLGVITSTRGAVSDGLVETGITLLDTGIDTERYFDRDLIYIDEHGFARLNLDSTMIFDRRSNPMVTAIP